MTMRFLRIWTLSPELRELVELLLQELEPLTDELELLRALLVVLEGAGLLLNVRREVGDVDACSSKLLLQLLDLRLRVGQLSLRVLPGGLLLRELVLEALDLANLGVELLLARATPERAGQ
jgi:hypothetical protein